MNPSLFILVSALLGAAGTALIRGVGLEHDYFELIMVENVVMLLACGAWMLARRVPFRTPCLKLHLARGVMGFIASVASVQLAQQIPVALAECMLYTSPFFILLIVWISGSDRSVSFSTLAGILVIGFAGCLMVLSPGSGGVSARHVALGLVLGGSAACATLLLRALGSRGEPVVRTTFYISAFCFTAGTLFGTWECGPCPVRNILGDPVVLVLGVLSLAVQICRAAGWKYGKWFVNTVFYFTGIPFAALFGLLFFGEVPGVVALAGMLMIALASVTATRLQGRGSGSALHRVARAIASGAARPSNSANAREEGPRRTADEDRADA